MQLLVRLNPNHINMEGAGGGIPELTTSDINAALAGANKAGLELLIGQVCGAADFKTLYETFLPETLRCANRLKWSLVGSGAARVHKLLQIVLFEAISARKCPSCRGTKRSLLNPVDKCPTCYGSGVWFGYDRAKAKYLGISDQAWRKTWREREKDIQALLDRRIYQAKKRIHANLYGELLT